jgi:hypothetical protein
MATNTLTNLIGALYKSLDVISRELVGVIPCVTLDADVARAAVGQLVTSFNSPQSTATDITPGVLPPDDGEQVFGSTSLTITKSRRVPFRWNGEQERALNVNGSGAQALKNAQMTQAMRTLVNEMEVDCFNAVRVAASRAYGTAGTTPFATGVGESAQVRKLLDDNGAPATDRALIIDTTAGASLRTNTQLTKANEAGTELTLRSGELLDLHGLSIHESAAVRAVTKGTGASYTTNTTGYAIGATDITLITGTGTVLAGDTVTFTGDTNKYVVVTGVAAPGVISIGAPGLKAAIAASAVAMTVGNNATQNIAFNRSAIILATRAPALPDGGDSAVDRITITDPRSGISFEVAMYAQYRQMQYEISAAWGVKGIKPNHTVQLLG